MRYYYKPTNLSNLLSPWQKKYLDARRKEYRDGLLNDTIPFWFPNCIDPEHGGYFTGVNQFGQVLQPDKSVWFQGRGAWTLANLYNHVEQRPEWLEYAKNGLDFIENHCFDKKDGRMFFSVTREGAPLRKRRYWFSEAFAVIAYAAYSKATGDSAYMQKAESLFEKILYYHNTPGVLPAKVDPETRPSKGLSPRMILMATAQELRSCGSAQDFTPLIDSLIEEIQRDFLKPKYECVLEEVGPNGELIDTFEGRVVNPGHSMELGWFILAEAKYRNWVPEMVELGTRIVKDAFWLGWDRECGGIFYFRDCKKLPTWEYWSDMKFWWPHNEAIIATLFGWQMSGEAMLLREYQMLHEWAYERFPDPEYGEWFGYLHRDGTPSTVLKGSMWKGPFHLPRMQLLCWKMIDEILGPENEHLSNEPLSNEPKQE